MEVLDVKIDLFKHGLKKDDSWNHEMLTDCHVGHPNFAKTEFKRAVKRISDGKNRVGREANGGVQHSRKFSRQTKGEQ